jgi:hypothetical protein
MFGFVVQILLVWIAFTLLPRSIKKGLRTPTEGRQQRERMLPSAATCTPSPPSPPRRKRQLSHHATASLLSSTSTTTTTSVTATPNSIDTSSSTAVTKTTLTRSEDATNLSLEVTSSTTSSSSSLLASPVAQPQNEGAARSMAVTEQLPVVASLAVDSLSSVVTAAATVFVTPDDLASLSSSPIEGQAREATPPTQLDTSISSSAPLTTESSDAINDTSTTLTTTSSSSDSSTISTAATISSALPSSAMTQSSVDSLSLSSSTSSALSGLWSWWWPTTSEVTSSAATTSEASTTMTNTSPSLVEATTTTTTTTACDVTSSASSATMSSSSNGSVVSDGMTDTDEESLSWHLIQSNDAPPQHLLDSGAFLMLPQPSLSSEVKLLKAGDVASTLATAAIDAASSSSYSKQGASNNNRDKTVADKYYGSGGRLYLLLKYDLAVFIFVCVLFMISLMSRITQVRVPNPCLLAQTFLIPSCIFRCMK